MYKGTFSRRVQSLATIFPSHECASKAERFCVIGNRNFLLHKKCPAKAWDRLTAAFTGHYHDRSIIYANLNYVYL